MSSPVPRAAVLALATTLALALPAFVVRDASGSPAALEEAPTQVAPYTVEYVYKVRWGHFAEWLELYRRNHYPILERLQELGDIVEMSAVSPMHHAGEEDRWDFRFTIVWRDPEAAHAGRDREPILRELYPDRERFEAEEQRRFELLEAHMDVPVVSYALSGW